MKEPFPDSAKLAGRVRTLSRPLDPVPTDMSPRLPPMPGVRAVLFDVYGTLFISAAGDIDAGQSTDGITALQEALESMEIQGQTEEAARVGSELLPQLIRHEHARRHTEGTKYPEVNLKAVWKSVTDELGQRNLLRDQISEEEVARLAVEYECRVNPVWPMPHLRETLEALWRHAFLLGIVSNAQFFTPLLFKAFLGEELGPLGFQPELCAWSWDLLEAKPSKALFREPLRSLRANYGVSPDQVLYVGNDMLNDILPAQKLGCRTALFAGDKRSLRRREDDQRCTGLRPTAVIQHLAQLMEILPVSRAHHNN